MARSPELLIADRNGREISAVNFFRKEKPPALGNKFGSWAGRDAITTMSLPGGGFLQFDLSKLTLQDFRSMRDNYQINASLSVLSFMMHQIDWHVKCENKKIADTIEDILRRVWPRMIRALTQAYWAGYSPIVLQWENNPQTGNVEITKFKDLVPEECVVNWKKVKGYAPSNQVPPVFYEYNGIKQGVTGLNITGETGSYQEIPPECTLWYPLLSENGDYYGRKLLRPAFAPWFYSTIIHLFANRYFERFGEPTPVGRADFDDQVQQTDGSYVTGNVAMENVLNSLRNRSVVVLPSDRDPETKEYLYSLEYLESQMRGADFERYLTRLDEEMSLSVFTPILLFRTAEVGSYNLGVNHLQTYLLMLNSLAADLKDHIDKYVIERLKAYNFSPNAPRAEWVPRHLGKDNVETMRSVVQAVISQGMAKPDLVQLGEAIGLSLDEITQMTGETEEPEGPDYADADVDSDVDRIRTQAIRREPRGVGSPRPTERRVAMRAAEIAERERIALGIQV